MKLISLFILLIALVLCINCLDLNKYNIINHYNNNSSDNNNNNIQENNYIFIFSNNQSIGFSFIFLLNECLPSFYNEFIVSQHYFDQSTNITTISFEYFNNNNCFGKPIFNKKWVGIAPFQDYIPFMSPLNFNTTDPQQFTIDVKQPFSIPLNSVIVQMFPNINPCSSPSIYGYAVYAANSSISANGEISTLSCVNNVPQSKTCNAEGCDDPLVVNECLVSNSLSILGFCSNSTYFPFK